MLIDQPPTPEQPTRFSPRRKVVYLALIILALIAIGAFATTYFGQRDKYYALGFGFILLFLGGAEALILFLIGLVKFFTRRPGDLGHQVYFLASGLVILIGGSACFGGIFALDALG